MARAEEENSTFCGSDFSREQNSLLFATEVAPTILETAFIAGMARSYATAVAYVGLRNIGASGRGRPS